MNSLQLAGLWCCCLWFCCLALLVCSAPVPESSVTDTPEFKRTVERAKTLVEKILRDIPSVHQTSVSSQGLTLDPSSQTENLEYLMTSLGISKAPVLIPLSAHFTLEMSVSRMLQGVLLYQDQLGALKKRLATAHTVTELLADLKDLHTQITRMQELGQMTPPAPSEGSGLAWRLSGDYEVQVAVHLTLLHLRSFTHDLIRSLRHISPPARG